MIVDIRPLVELVKMFLMLTVCVFLAKFAQHTGNVIVDHFLMAGLFIAIMMWISLAVILYIHLLVTIYCAFKSDEDG